MLPEAIFFDLDGTLLDSLPGIQYSAQEAVCTVWPGRPLPDLRPLIGPPIDRVLQQALPDATATQIGRAVAAFRQSYDSCGWQKTILFPGASELLSNLNECGIRCFVASNKPSHITRQILGHLGIASRFTAITCRDSRTPPYGSKAQIVATLLREFAIDPEIALLTGDCYDDYEAAQCNGISFILAGYGYGSDRCASLKHTGAYLTQPGDLWNLLQRTTTGVHHERGHL